MSDALKAQAASLRHGIQVSKGEIEQAEGTLGVMKADVHNMEVELESIEAFLRVQEVKK